ncbi:MAG: DUF4058 family protein [Fimbriiglobus sp.]
MPLRDHFHPPLSHRTSWEGFHGQWPAMMILELNHVLPEQYVAEPRVHVGAEIEIDIGTMETDPPAVANIDTQNGLEFSLAEPSVAAETELLDDSEYEVRVYDVRHQRRLVAAVEIVSPSNKDRPESRRVFVAKCHELLRRGVSVSIIDLVTSKNFNLYTDLLELVGHSDLSFGPEPSPIYAATCRWIPRGRKHVLETWSHILHVGQPLPTLPMLLTETLPIPLELETSYLQTCQALRLG